MHPEQSHGKQAIETEGERQNRMNKKFSFGAFFSKYNLVVVLAFIIVMFSILRPGTYLSVFNVRSVLNYQSVVILLALAVMVPIAAGHFDLSVGYNCCLMHILSIGLIVKQHLPWWAAMIIVVAIGVLVGIINGFLVTVVRIDSFIATLGVGTIINALAYWYCDSKQVIGELPKEFLAINSSIGGVIPTTILITVIIGIILFIVMDYLPMGRFFYFLGKNAKASELCGVSEKKYTMIAFVFAGVVTAIASIMLASILRVGQTSVGPDYLMNSFAGALMGSVVFKQGKVNVWGTCTAVLVIAFTVAGLQQMGAPYFVEPLFNGIMLIVAVSLAVVTERRRVTKVDKERKEAIRKGAQNNG